MIQATLRIETIHDEWRVELLSIEDRTIVLVKPLTDTDLAGVRVLPKEMRSWAAVRRCLSPGGRFALTLPMQKVVGGLIMDRVLGAPRLREHLARLEGRHQDENRPVHFLVDVEETDPTISGIPLELAYSGDSKQFFFKQPDRPVFRCSSTADARNLNLRAGSRVLLVTAHDEGRSPSAEELEAHALALQGVLGRAGMVSEWLRDASPESLNARLRSGPTVDILYIACHGMSAEDNCGALRLRQGLLTGQTLGKWLEEARRRGQPVSVVMLAACSSAIPQADAGTSGMAQWLSSRERAHATVGFRGPVSVTWALAFFERLFSHLGKGAELEAAYAAARLSAADDDAQWALPLLFSRPRDLSAADKKVAVKKPTARQKYLRWRGEDIQNRLRTSIHAALRLDLGLMESQDTVRPWTFQPYDNKTQHRTFRNFSDAFELYRRRLLLLGSPGSGKTTTLLELARILVHKAENDISAPIPLLLSLSQWQDSKHSIAEWLIQMTARLPGLSKTLAKTWVRHGHVALLLDGLDEVSESRRRPLVAALNEYLRQHSLMTVVICSRTAEFAPLKANPKAYRKRRSAQNRGKPEDRYSKLMLQLEGAVELKPLTSEQIDEYLEFANATGLRHALTHDADLQHLAEIPLILSMMVLAYGKTDPTIENESLPLVERRRRLFDTYVDRMMQRTARRAARDPLIHTEDQNPVDDMPTPYSREQVDRYLGWLGIRLAEQGRTVFSLKGLYRFLISGSRSGQWVTAGFIDAAAASLFIFLTIAASLISGIIHPMNNLHKVGFTLGVMLPAVLLSLFHHWMDVPGSPMRVSIKEFFSRFWHGLYISFLPVLVSIILMYVKNVSRDGVFYLNIDREPEFYYLINVAIGVAAVFIPSIGHDRFVLIDLGGAVTGVLLSYIVQTLRGEVPIFLITGLVFSWQAARWGSIGPEGRASIFDRAGIKRERTEEEEEKKKEPKLDGFLGWIFRSRRGAYAVAPMPGSFAISAAILQLMAHFWGLGNLRSFIVILLISILLQPGWNRIFDQFLERGINNQLASLLLIIRGYAPANMKTFLHYAENCLLLKRVGEDYEFTHMLLRDHFAMRKLLLLIRDKNEIVRLTTVQQLSWLKELSREPLNIALGDSSPIVSAAAEAMLRKQGLSINVPCNVDIEDESRAADSGNFDPVYRQLCPNEDCIGIIGVDGNCRICGLLAMAKSVD